MISGIAVQFCIMLFSVSHNVGEVNIGRDRLVFKAINLVQSAVVRRSASSSVFRIAQLLKCPTLRLSSMRKLHTAFDVTGASPHTWQMYEEMHQSRMHLLIHTFQASYMAAYRFSPFKVLDRDVSHISSTTAQSFDSFMFTHHRKPNVTGWRCSPFYRSAI